MVSPNGRAAQMGETQNEGINGTFWRHVHENASKRGGSGVWVRILPKPNGRDSPKLILRPKMTRNRCTCTRMAINCPFPCISPISRLNGRDPHTRGSCGDLKCSCTSLLLLETHKNDAFWRHVHENALKRGDSVRWVRVLPAGPIGLVGESRPNSFRGQK